MLTFPCGEPFRVFCTEFKGSTGVWHGISQFVRLFIQKSQVQFKSSSYLNFLSLWCTQRSSRIFLFNFIFLLCFNGFLEFSRRPLISLMHNFSWFLTKSLICQVELDSEGKTVSKWKKARDGISSNFYSTHNTTASRELQHQTEADWRTWRNDEHSENS